MVNARQRRQNGTTAQNGAIGHGQQQHNTNGHGHSSGNDLASPKKGASFPALDTHALIGKDIAPLPPGVPKNNKWTQNKAALQQLRDSAMLVFNHGQARKSQSKLPKDGSKRGEDDDDSDDSSEDEGPKAREEREKMNKDLKAIMAGGGLTIYNVNKTGKNTNNNILGNGHKTDVQYDKNGNPVVSHRGDSNGGDGLMQGRSGGQDGGAGGADGGAPGGIGGALGGGGGGFNRMGASGYPYAAAGFGPNGGPHATSGYGGFGGGTNGGGFYNGPANGAASRMVGPDGQQHNGTASMGGNGAFGGAQPHGQPGVPPNGAQQPGGGPPYGGQQPGGMPPHGTQQPGVPPHGGQQPGMPPHDGQQHGDRNVAEQDAEAAAMGKGDHPENPNRYKKWAWAMAGCSTLTAAGMAFVIYSVATVAQLGHHQWWMWTIWIGCPITLFEALWMTAGAAFLARDPTSTMFGKKALAFAWIIIGSGPMIMAIILSVYVPERLHYDYANNPGLNGFANRIPILIFVITAILFQLLAPGFMFKAISSYNKSHGAAG